MGGVIGKMLGWPYSVACRFGGGELPYNWAGQARCLVAFLLQARPCYLT